MPKSTHFLVTVCIFIRKNHVNFSNLCQTCYSVLISRASAPGEMCQSHRVRDEASPRAPKGAQHRRTHTSMHLRTQARGGPCAGPRRIRRHYVKYW